MSTWRSTTASLTRMRANTSLRLMRSSRLLTTVITSSAGSSLWTSAAQPVRSQLAMNPARSLAEQPLMNSSTRPRTRTLG
jgi:hypothetical protein